MRRRQHWSWCVCRERRVTEITKPVDEHHRLHDDATHARMDRGRQQIPGARDSEAVRRFEIGRSERTSTWDRGECMHHDLWTSRHERRPQPVRVQRGADDPASAQRLDLFESARGARQSNDLVSCLNQAANDWKSERACGAGNKDSHPEFADGLSEVGGLLSPTICAAKGFRKGHLHSVAVGHPVCLGSAGGDCSREMVASESPKWPLSRIGSRRTVMTWA
jgi:hypothetical protein